MNKIRYKNKMKFFVAILLILCVQLFSSPAVQGITIDSVINGANNFIDTGGNGSEKINPESVKELSNSLYNMLLVIGVAVAAIVGTVLGIQFITGTVEQKSKVKESLIPYFVGCTVVFGAFGIWKLVVTILGKVA